MNFKIVFQNVITKCNKKIHYKEWQFFLCTGFVQSETLHFLSTEFTILFRHNKYMVIVLLALGLLLFIMSFNFSLCQVKHMKHSVANT